MKQCARCDAEILPECEAQLWVDLPIGNRFFLCRAHIGAILDGNARLTVDERQRPVYIEYETRITRSETVLI